MRKPVSQMLCTATARIADGAAHPAATPMRWCLCDSRNFTSRMNATTAINTGTAQQHAAFGEDLGESGCAPG